MIITVLWEDQHGGNVKGFGPHALLAACVADDLELEIHAVRSWVQPIPCKGNGSVVRKLNADLSRLKRAGSVVAVLDRDKAHKLSTPPSATCLTGIVDALKQSPKARAPGDYELVLLIDNVESLVNAARSAVGEASIDRKPTPDERDRILNSLAWDERSAARVAIRAAVPSFDRLVRRVAAFIPRAR